MPGEAGERQPEPDYSSLLPDYDTACAQALKQTPPPSYQAAMAVQQPSATPSSVIDINAAPITTVVTTTVVAEPHPAPVTVSVAPANPTPPSPAPIVHEQRGN